MGYNNVNMHMNVQCTHLCDVFLVYYLSKGGGGEFVSRNLCYISRRSFVYGKPQFQFSASLYSSQETQSITAVE